MEILHPLPSSCGRASCYPLPHSVAERILSSTLRLAHFPLSHISLWERARVRVLIRFKQTPFGASPNRSRAGVTVAHFQLINEADSRARAPHDAVLRTRGIFSEEALMSQAEKWGIRPLSNWGRWGKDDQLGTANFITAEVVARASKEVQQGQNHHLRGTDRSQRPAFPGRQPCVRMMSLMNMRGPRDRTQDRLGDQRRRRHHAAPGLDPMGRPFACRVRRLLLQWRALHRHHDRARRDQKFDLQARARA